MGLAISRSIIELTEGGFGRRQMRPKAPSFSFLTNRPQEAPSCLVLDVQLPGISGLDRQQELANGNAQIPIIFMTGYGDIPMTVRAMKSGRFRISHQTFPRRRFRSEVAPSSPAIWRSGGHRSRSGSVTNVQKAPDFYD